MTGRGLCPPISVCLRVLSAERFESVPSGLEALPVVQRMFHGFVQNVSAVCFHPSHGGSDPSLVRLCHLTAYHQVNEVIGNDRNMRGSRAIFPGRESNPIQGGRSPYTLAPTTLGETFIWFRQVISRNRVSSKLTLLSLSLRKMCMTYQKPITFFVTFQGAITFFVTFDRFQMTQPCEREKKESTQPQCHLDSTCCHPSFIISTSLPKLGKWLARNSNHAQNPSSPPPMGCSTILMCSVSLYPARCE